MCRFALREKCPYSELFWSVFPRIRTRITPNTNTFYAVSFNNLCNPNREIILSMVLPSKLVLSWLYQLLDLSLKSPIIVVRKNFFAPEFLTSFQKYQKKFQTHL